MLHSINSVTILYRKFSCKIILVLQTQIRDLHLSQKNLYPLDYGAGSGSSSSRIRFSLIHAHACGYPWSRYRACFPSTLQCRRCPGPGCRGAVSGGGWDSPDALVCACSSLNFMTWFLPFNALLSSAVWLRSVQPRHATKDAAWDDEFKPPLPPAMLWPPASGFEDVSDVLSRDRRPRDCSCCLLLTKGGCFELRVSVALPAGLGMWYDRCPWHGLHSVQNGSLFPFFSPNGGWGCAGAA